MIIHLRTKLKTENMSEIDNKNIIYKRITHDFKRYEKVCYEFYNIHKTFLALDLPNVLYITCVTPIVIKNLPYDIFKDRSKLHWFSAREPFLNLNLNLNVEMCVSNPVSLALNPLAASFNYVSTIVSVLPNCFINLTGFRSSCRTIYSRYYPG